MALTSINPATGEQVAEFEEHSVDEVERRIGIAGEAFRDWSARPVSARAGVLSRMAELLDAEHESLGRLMTLEMGKTFASATGEARKCAAGCRYYAENAAEIIAPMPIEGDGDGRGEVRFQPLGAVLAVMPWNFPFWQVIRFAAPALAAGNVGLLKHASNVPQCAMALEDLWRRAGAPNGVFQTLLIGSSRVESVVADSRVAAVTLTGSEGAGRAVATIAGRHLKKTVLELGRFGSIHRRAVRESRRGHQDRRRRAHHQQRTVLHRGETIHRGRQHRRCIHDGIRQADVGTEGRRSNARWTPTSVRSPRPRFATNCTRRCGRPFHGAPRRCWAGRPWSARGGSTSPPC